MSDATMDPRAIAQAVAIEVADEDSQVGDFVEAIDLGDNVTDFRFETRVRGYEGWLPTRRCVHRNGFRGRIVLNRPTWR